MLHVFTSLLGGAPFVHSLGFVQWDSTRWDHPGYPGRVSGSDPVTWLHPIKAISVKRDKSGVPRPEGVCDSGHEHLDEDELHYYRARFGFLGDP